MDPVTPEVEDACTSLFVTVAEALTRSVEELASLTRERRSSRVSRIVELGQCPLHTQNAMLARSVPIGEKQLVTER